MSEIKHFIEIERINKNEFAIPLNQCKNNDRNQDFFDINKHSAFNASYQIISKVNN